jgi:hypothetical protein
VQVLYLPLGGLGKTEEEIPDVIEEGMSTIFRGLSKNAFELSCFGS